MCTLVSEPLLAVKEPAALRRRMHAGPTAETRTAQKIVMTGDDGVAVIAVLVISALDHRFGWSSVPIPVVIIGNILVAVGLVIAKLVVNQNSYAAATITVEAEQKVVSTGLYGLVRHPMYAGTLIMMVGMPLALDSYWGLVTLVRQCRFLRPASTTKRRCCGRNSTAMTSTRSKVHYRLVPGVW